MMIHSLKVQKRTWTLKMLIQSLMMISHIVQTAEKNPILVYMSNYNAIATEADFSGPERQLAAKASSRSSNRRVSTDFDH